MTEGEARAQFEGILGSLGIRRGDTVFLGIDMGKVPLPAWQSALDRDAIRAREESWCEFVHEILMSALGPDGTLLVPSFSYDYARKGVPYTHEESPAETGPFTEYLRRRPEAVRSFHPLNSIAGVGANARAILENVGKTGYGAASPFARLGDYGTKFLFLGTPPGRALVHAHHMEHMYGVNHMYHKIYNTPVTRRGAIAAGPWLCFVRYLGAGVAPRIANLEDRLRQLELIGEYHDWPHPMQCIGCSDVERVGYEMLCEDPCAFLESPVEVHIAAPGAAEQPRRVRAVHLALV